MSTVWSVLTTPLGVALRLGAMLLTVAQLYLLLRTRLQHSGPGPLLRSGLHALWGLLLLTLLMDGAYRVEYLPYERAYPFAVRFVGSLPWAAVAALEAASGLVCLLSAWRIRAYARSHPSAQSVKQTVDLLPTGFCVAEEEGLTLLSNLKMNACSLALTGRSAADAEALWQAALARGERREGKLLVRLPDGAALLMERGRFEQDGRRLVQLTAEDVTEQFRMTATLEEKNARLQEVQARLKTYQRQRRELVIRQELLAARTTVHNQLGGVLLTGKYYLEHPGRMDRTALFLLLRHLNSYLLSEAEAPEDGTDRYDRALQAAAGFGVTVEVTGELPPPGTLRSLLGQAVVECAANAVKHAGGDRLCLTLEPKGFTITNNGAPPPAEIRPAGGLLSLRQAAEEAGCTVRIQSSPRFALTVTQP